MKPSLVPVQTSEEEEWIDFLQSREWPFHGESQPERNSLKKRFASLFRADIRCYWLVLDSSQVGLIKLSDLSNSPDEFPILDLRIAKSSEGKGLATCALQELVSLCFTQLGQRRLEGYTQEDNLGMQRVFEKCGFLKQAHLRESWPGKNGEFFDTYGYAILKREWEQNRSEEPL